MFKYHAVKEKMKTGDLLQWRSNSVVGSLIRWRTRADVNHSSLVMRFAEYQGEERRRFTTEALEHGTVLNLLSRRLETFDGSCWWHPLRPDWNNRRREIGERALDLIGIPYDYRSIVSQIFGRVSSDARRLFCSEYCFLCYGQEGIAPTPADMPLLGIFGPGVQIL
jgi:hypothetical protein